MLKFRNNFSVSFPSNKTLGPSGAYVSALCIKDTLGKQSNKFLEVKTLCKMSKELFLGKNLFITLLDSPNHAYAFSLCVFLCFKVAMEKYFPKFSQLILSHNRFWRMMSHSLVFCGRKSCNKDEKKRECTVRRVYY